MGGGAFELRIGSHAPERPQGLSGGARTPVGYDRDKAVGYARYFCSRVCSDGFIMSGERQHPRKAGAFLDDVKAVNDENDCTHFVSCCLGTLPPFKDETGAKIQGGGLVLDRGDFFERGKSGVYGVVQPGTLAHQLQRTSRITFAKVDNGVLGFSNDTPHLFDNTTSAVEELRGLVQDRFPGDLGKGDLVVYYQGGTAHHAAILVNDQWGIACHTHSRCGAVGITDVNSFPKFLYARFKQFKEDVL